jgi:hypothetical protein
MGACSSNAIGCAVACMPCVLWGSALLTAMYCLCAACSLQVYLHDSMFKPKDSSSSSSSSFDLVSYVDTVMPGG